MEASYSSYDFYKSIERIDDILNGSDASYEDKDSVPPRNSLTFNNGFYVECAALFVDMRGSKNLAEKHKRPVLAKIYKTYISELVAILKSHTKVCEISIEGDCVWGVYNTQYKFDLDELFGIGAKVSSLIDILNIKYKRKGYSELTVGIGISYGTALLIKAGYSGSGINEVVWLGKLVGEAAKLCSYGNKTAGEYEIMVSNVFYNNLNEHNKMLLLKNNTYDCYHGYIINTDMNEWVKKNG
ncbi:adenylate/guanylate cyclase domain-containing protein [Aeromonas sp. s12]|uniref:adenylate/guanylate cyclase domain-containing protein n=1 Tax=Aeromonas sp. s12 TaxID=3138482 RepID=UPI0034A3FA39